MLPLRKIEREKLCLHSEMNLITEITLCRDSRMDYFVMFIYENNKQLSHTVLLNR